MAGPDPFDHPLRAAFVRFMNSRYLLAGIDTLRAEFPIYLAGVEAGAAQEKDNARRERDADPTARVECDPKWHPLWPAT
jgi:hypothetical protein